MTTTTTTVNTTVLAADELIAVTGERSIPKQWDLADALLKASPTIDTYELAAVRQAAVDKAGHDEFWQVPRLRQLAKTAEAWPVADRIADVALDTHLEAARKTATLADAKKAIAKAGQTSKVPGKPSIREVRAVTGANGTTAAPPRVDKADGGELFRRLLPRQKELAEYLRKNLRVHAADIVAFHTLFSEYDAKVKALAATKKADDAPVAPKAPSTKVDRKQRVKGL